LRVPILDYESSTRYPDRSRLILFMAAAFLTPIGYLVPAFILLLISLWVGG
jgi:hypothetical protein